MAILEGGNSWQGWVLYGMAWFASEVEVLLSGATEDLN